MIHRIFLLATVFAFLNGSRTLDAADARPKPAPFAKAIAAFEEADAKAPPEKGGVLFIGSSSIVLWKTLEKDFPGVKTINRGFGGSKIPHSTLYADRIVIPYAPKTIIFYAGDNDISGGATAEQVAADFKTFAEKVHAALPETRILFIAIKPSIARWKLVDEMRKANALIKAYAETSPKTLGYIDVFTPMLGSDGKPRPELLGKDGLHMTRAGYEVWRDAVKPMLEN